VTADMYTFYVCIISLTIRISFYILAIYSKYYLHQIAYFCSVWAWIKFENIQCMSKIYESKKHKYYFYMSKRTYVGAFLLSNVNHLHTSLANPGWIDQSLVHLDNVNTVF